MTFKKVLKEISLKAVVNKANHQINFNLRKTDLPESIKIKLPKLKSIKLKMEDFEFD